MTKKQSVMKQQFNEGTAWRTVLVLFVIIAVGLPKLFIHLEYWQWSLLQCFFSVIGAVISVIVDTKMGTRYFTGFINWLAIYTSLFILFELFYGTMQTGYKLPNIFNLLSVYSYILFSLPIYYMLRREYISLKGLLLIVAISTGISLVVRFSLSFVESSAGIALCPDISLENAAKGWVRNGIVRINPPSLSALMVGICMYWVLYETKYRSLFGVILILQIVYTNFIHAARSTFLVSLVAIIILLVFKTKKTRLTYVVLSMIGLLSCLAVLYEPIFNSVLSFIGSFSSKGASELAGSTVARLRGLDYFSSIYLKTNPILGLGALGYQEQIALSGGYTFDDLGSLGIVFQFGLVGIFFYFQIYGRAIQACIRAHTCNYLHVRELGQLVLGFLIVLIMSSVNIDLFYMYAASAPFLVGISEYVIFSAENEAELISYLDREV